MPYQTYHLKVFLRHKLQQCFFWICLLKEIKANLSGKLIKSFCTAKEIIDKMKRPR